MFIIVLTGGEIMVMELSDIVELIHQEYPDKVLIDLSEYENEEHQTYKFLYEQLNEIYAQKINELGLVVSDIRSTPKDKSIDTESFVKTISSVPGIYGGKRPSWYTPLKIQLSKENVKRKNVGNTIGSLKNKLSFWKGLRQIGANHKKQSLDKIATAYDEYRKNNILELLHENCSNEEKYLKYFLLTPGIDQEYLKTLQGAAEINLDANLVIALLEQPSELFNREIIEGYRYEVQGITDDVDQNGAVAIVNIYNQNRSQYVRYYLVYGGNSDEPELLLQYPESGKTYSLEF